MKIRNAVFMLAFAMLTFVAGAHAPPGNETIQNEGTYIMSQEVDSAIMNVDLQFTSYQVVRVESEFKYQFDSGVLYSNFNEKAPMIHLGDFSNCTSIREKPYILTRKSLQGNTIEINVGKLVHDNPNISQRSIYNRMSMSLALNGSDNHIRCLIRNIHI